MKIIAGLPPAAKKGELVAIDFETYGQTEGKLHRPNGTFACVSCCLEGSPGIVYQMYDANDLRTLKMALRPAVWVFHNALYDLRQFRRHTDIAPRFIWDTMLADQSMYGGYYPTFGLGDLSRRWLSKPMEKDTRDDFITKRDMSPTMKKYAALDAQRALEIAIKQRAEYTNDPAFSAYLEADEPMIFPILDMPGIRIDVERWTKMVVGFQKRAAEIEAELDINVKSVEQVKILAAKYKIHLLNTKNETLTEFADVPIIAKVIEGRLYRDAVSKYGLTWLEKHVEADGKVYSDYKITGADQTGRMSSSNPNEQNIPIKKLPKYRACFIASDGHVMEISDISQQEPCIIAYESQDENLLRIIRSGKSAHLAVAQEIFNNPKLKKTNLKEYKVGKQINLGTAYGLSDYGLAARLHIPQKEAKAFLDKYFAKFGGVSSYVVQRRQQGLSVGYVSTALGRRSYLNIHDRKWMNNAINSPIQGGAADYTKIWGRKLWEKTIEHGLPYTTVGFIHDEIIRDTPLEIIAESKRIKQEAFDETAEKLYPGIPFSLSSDYGRSWGAKEIREEMLDIDDE